MIVLGEPVALPGVPDGLLARARVESRDEGAVRRDRRGRLRLRHGVALVAAEPSSRDTGQVLGALADRHGQDLARMRALVLDAGRRSRAPVEAALGAATDAVACDLARHDLVRLVAEVADDGALRPWHRWEHTPRLAEAAARAADERDRRRQRLSTAAERVVEQAAARGWARTARWLGDLTLPSGADESELASFERLLAALPAQQTPLSILGREVTGDTHGLDRDRWTGRKAAELAAVLAVDLGRRNEVGDAGDAAGWRAAWDAVGVAADALSCSVLTWWLPAGRHATGAAAQSLAASRDAEPAWLTLRALLGSTGGWAGPTGEGRVHLVEGTALMELAAAEKLPVPLVCHGGVPNSAVLELCRQLVDAGWRLAVSADMEPTPLSAVAGMLTRFAGAAEPWRLAAEDLDDAQRSGKPFAPARVPDTPWDPRLAERLRADPRRSTEEDRLEALQTDLRTAPSTTATSRPSQA